MRLALYSFLCIFLIFSEVEAGEGNENMQALGSLGLEVAHPHFYFVLLAKANHRATHTQSPGREAGLTPFGVSLSHDMGTGEGMNLGQ